jgi:hypothetical protein
MAMQFRQLAGDRKQILIGSCGRQVTKGPKPRPKFPPLHRSKLRPLAVVSLEKKIKADNLPIKIAGTGKNRKLVYDPQQKWKFWTCPGFVDSCELALRAY